MTSHTLPFEDDFGEFRLVINNDQTGTIYIQGGGEPIGTIEDDTLPVRPGVSVEEFWWMAVCWRKATGRKLRFSTEAMFHAEVAKVFAKLQDTEDKVKQHKKNGFLVGPATVLCISKSQLPGETREEVLEYLASNSRHDIAVMLVDEDGPATTNGQAL